MYIVLCGWAWTGSAMWKTTTAAAPPTRNTLSRSSNTSLPKYSSSTSCDGGEDVKEVGEKGKKRKEKRRREGEDNEREGEEARYH